MQNMVGVGHKHWHGTGLMGYAVMISVIPLVFASPLAF